MPNTHATTTSPLFCPCPRCVQLGIVCKLSKHSSKCKKYAEDKKNCRLRRFSVRFRRLLKKKATLRQENQYLQEQLAAIDDRMTEIEDLEDEVMLVEDAVDNNKQETTESPTQDLIFYHSVLSDKISTPLNHLMESDELLASFESVQDSDFDLLALALRSDFPTEDSSGENLIEL